VRTTAAARSGRARNNGSVSAQRGWITEPIPPTPYLVHGVEAWAQRHRDQGHHPYPAPTPENPELWACECGHIWRILTPDQIRRKFAGMFSAARARRADGNTPGARDSGAR
jgi:hypothetical protein